MLEKVRLIWIKGFLEPALDQLARIDLGLEPKPDAVDRPFDLLVQRPEQAPHPLPMGTPISHIFDEAGKALLILGEPGAGKTILLLELTRDLLDRAAQDERHLIPVVFHLSSWADQRLPLADWLMDELEKRYDVPRKQAKAWVDADLLLPLLDGLDEVAAAHQEACVTTINRFVHEHGLVPLVVCSRIADYTALTGRLRLPSTVLIQALRRQQVQHYVDQAGAALVGLRTALQHHESLWELLNTPLMLSIAALAYQGRAVDEMRSSGILEDYRTQLFAAYTDAMFHRRARTTPYSREQTEHWLMWLARAMKAHHQSIFYLESLQPDLLDKPKQRNSIKYIIILPYIMLLYVSGVGSVVAAMESHFEVSIWTLIILPAGFMFVPLLFMKGELAKIELMNGLRWSWSAVRFKRLILFAPLLAGLLSGLLLVQLREQGAWLDGLCLGGLVWFVVGVMWLVTGVTSEIALYSSPNEGIKRSGRQGLTTVLLGLSGLFASSLADGLFFYPSIKLSQVLFGWLTGTPVVVGLTSGLACGGKAWLQHFALRLLLWHNNFAPLNYIRFLDYAAARIFLRKVGGGYIFIHRMLLEYFAARDQKQHLENLMASTQICSACGAQRVRDWRYCHHCGQPFPSGSIS